MVTPIPVPSDGSRSGVKNQTTFYETVKDNQRRLDTLERSSPLRNASVGSGGVTFYDGGQLKFSQQGTPDDPTPGVIWADPDEGLNYLRVHPPWTDGPGSIQDENSIVLQGSAPGSPGNGWWFTDGLLTFITQDAAGNPAGGVDFFSPRIRFVATDPAGGVVQFFGLPTSGASANLVLDGADLKVSPSSERYKENFGPVEIDPVEVLQLSGRTFTMVGDDTGQRFVGFVAEDLDRFPSLRQFVNYDDQGRPDSISYDRLTVAVVEVLKEQQTKLSNMGDLLTRSVDLLSALAESNASLTRRVETLETQP